MPRLVITCLIFFSMVSLAIAQSLEDRFVKLRQTDIQHLKTTEERKAAIDLCLEFTRKYANDPSKRALVIEAYRISGKIRRMIGLTQNDAAIADLRTGLERVPQNPILYRELGLLYLDMEKLGEAREYLEKAVRLNSNDLDAYRGLIKLAMQTGDEALQATYYTNYLKADSTDASTWVKLGKVQQAQGQNDKAEISYKRALQIDSTHTDARLMLAGILEKKGEFAEAAKTYSEILFSDHTNLTVRKRLAELELRLQKQERIDDHLKKGQTYLNSLRVQDWALSLTEFSKVLEVEPENLTAKYGFSRARKKLCDHYYDSAKEREIAGNWQLALDYYTSSVVYADSDADRERAFNKQKLATLKLGKIIEARNAQEAARLSLESGQFTDALKKLAVVEILDPTLREEIQPALKTAEISENYRRGKDAFARGDYELAKSYFELVLKLDPNYTEARRYRNEAERQASIKFLVSSFDSARAKHDWLSARTYLQELVALVPESTQYAANLKDVERRIPDDQVSHPSRLVMWVLAGMLGFFLTFVVITVKSRRRSHKIAELSQFQSIAGFDIEKFDNYRVLTKEWQQAIKAMERQDSAAFWVRAIAVGQRVAEACHLEVSFDSLHKSASLSTPIVTSVRASTISSGTRLPANLPLFLLPGAELSEASLTQLYHSIDEQTGSSHKFALMIPFSPETDIQRLKQTLKARQALAYDVVALGFDELRQIVVAIDPIRALRKLILSQVDLSLVSTFTITGPTPDDMFFGREAELREIVQKAYEKSYALIGGRRMGKTSVLLRLHRVRLAAAGFRTINHDCSITTYENFLAAPIHDWYPEPPLNAPATFGELLHCPPSDKPLVLLLDEADKLVAADRTNSWRLFNTLRALGNSGRVQIVLSGERILREALRDSTGPLFNLANEMLIGRLDLRAVEELVTRPMKQLEIELADEDGIVHCIYDFTSGHPNVVQRLCRRLIERLNEQGTRRITINEVQAVIHDPGFQRDDFLSTYWEGTTLLERIISLLMAEDEHVRTLRGIRKALADRCGLRSNARAVDDALQRLVDLRSILGRTPEGYIFAVKAFPRVVANTITSRDMLEVLAEEYQEQME